MIFISEQFEFTIHFLEFRLTVLISFVSFTAKPNQWI